MRSTYFFIAVFISLPLLGCVQFKQKVVDVFNPTPVAKTAWQPTAQGITVHPATRVRTEGKQLIVDARVRMIDALGDSTKNSGAWHFELNAVTGLTQGRKDLLQVWNVEILKFEEHQAQFDAITRTYRFALELEKVPESKKLQLLVVFTPTGSNQRMAQEFDLVNGDK